MTREEAKEILTHNWTRVDNPNYSESELDEAFFMAIEALSAEAVSREEYEELYRKAKEVNGMANDILADFPSYKELVSADAVPFDIQLQSTREVLDQFAEDRVKVVRCKDCKHRDLFSCPLVDNDFQKDEDFCSWAERREE